MFKQCLLHIKIIPLVLIAFSPAAISQKISNCPASPYPITVKQHDGTLITIVAKGGMLHSWAETVDGYSIIKRKGIYEYATKVNGKLVASGVAARDSGERKPKEKIFLQNRAKSLSPDPPFTGKQAFTPSALNTIAPGKVGYPPAGNVKALMLLIKYPDLGNTYSPSNFNSLMNQPNYRGTGSFKDFYSTSSFGKLNITTDVFGWYTASHNYSYYGYSNYFFVATELVREAIDAAEAAGVDFSKYDNNGDGIVDGIIVVHAGPGAEEGAQGQYIWSHRWVLDAGGNAVSYDGVYIDDYIMNPERRIFTAGMVGRGIFCHEFGHNLGLPDLYDIDGGSEGLGEWSLMASANWLGNEHTPGNMDAWCKSKLQWVNPVVLKTNGSYTINAASESSEVYRINTQLSNEYFLLENRQKRGLDVSLNGSGLAIFHINTDKADLTDNRVNANEDLKGIDLEEADGLNDLDNQNNRGDDGDLFPGRSINFSFTHFSLPNSRTYTNANSNVDISNISVDGNGKASFILNFTGAPSITLTSPANNSSYTAPATIKLSAINNNNAGIAYVQFYNGTTLLATDSTSPYNYTFNNVAAGNYSFIAKVKNNNSLEGSSASIAVHVATPANKAPVVSITAPPDNRVFKAPASITLRASAADPDGTVSSVQFYRNGILLKAVSISPYSYTIRDVPAGNYSFVAKAVDNKGLGASSPSIALPVSVPANKAPIVNIISPANNAVVSGAANTSIKATATDPDGTVRYVKFYNGATLLRTDSISPYSYTMNNAAAGNYSFIAKAFDNKGLSNSSASLNITILPAANKAPVVNIINPISNSFYIALQDILVQATTSDIDGAVSYVKFYRDGTLLRKDSTLPFSYTMRSVAAGNYSLTAEATDNKGLTALSATINISVTENKKPVIKISYPYDNTFYDAPGQVDICTVASDSDGTVTDLEYYNGATLLKKESTNDRWVRIGDLAPGYYSLTARATDNLGLSATSRTVPIAVVKVDTFEAEKATLYGAAVAKAATGFTGSGYVECQNASGDYIEWTVNSAASDLYNLWFYYSNGTATNRPMQLRVNGLVVSEKLDFTPSGSWSGWFASGISLNLNSGINKIRLTTTGLGGPNLDKMVVKPIPCLLGTLEAEEAILNGALSLANVSGYSGSGYADFKKGAGNYIEWTVNAPYYRNYSLQFRYANGDVVNRPLKLEINDVMIAPDLAFTPTGGWGKWSVSSVNADLGGIVKVRLTSPGGQGPNIDNVAFTCINSFQSVMQRPLFSKSTLTGLDDIFKAEVVPNPSTGGRVTFTLQTSSVLPVDVMLVDILGRNYKSTRLPFKGAKSFDFSVSDIPPGVYTIMVTQGKQSTHSRLVVGRK